MSAGSHHASVVFWIVAQHAGFVVFFKTTHTVLEAFGARDSPVANEFFVAHIWLPLALHVFGHEVRLDFWIFVVFWHTPCA